MNDFDKEKLREINLIATCSGAASIMACIFALMAMYSYTEPEFDALGLMMAILQTFLSIVAVGGFFLIRNVAANKAVETAENELEKYLEEDGRGVILIRRSVESWLEQNPGFGNAQDQTGRIMEGLDDV